MERDALLVVSRWSLVKTGWAKDGEVRIAAILEVMDKEPALWALVAWYMLATVGGYLLCRWRTWTALLVLPTIFVFSNVAELRDRYMGAAIMKEAGLSYFIVSWAGLTCALVLPALGVIRKLQIAKSRRLTTTTKADD